MPARSIRLQLFWALLASMIVSSGRAGAQSSADTLQNMLHRATTRDGSHDFDFEFGTWTVHLSRRLHPLSGSTTWVEYDGTSDLQKVWNGTANLGEFHVAGSTGQIDGLSLRLYNPQAHQWNISWANRSDGTLTQAMVGQFENGRGEFFDQESFNGRAIFARFVFSKISADAFRLEQSFSGDGGQTWEVNWIAKFTRVADAKAR